MVASRPTAWIRSSASRSAAIAGETPSASAASNTRSATSKMPLAFDCARANEKPCNQIADAASVASQGPVGDMAGLPVFTNAALTKIRCLSVRFEDLYLWETDVTRASFDAPYADSMSVLRRAHGYSGMIASRHPASIAVISGTGMVTPAY